MRYLSESLWVALGAAIGANGRFWIGIACKASKQEFPWPTLLINVLGSMALGAFAAASFERGGTWPWKLFFAFGLCGGFTTFSTFSFETIDLFYSRSWKIALIYAVLSLVMSIGACFAGGHFGRIAFAQKKDPVSESS